MEGLFENLNNLVPLVPLLIFVGTLMRRARKASSGNSQKKSKVSGVSEGKMDFREAETQKAMSGELWPSERPVEEESLQEKPAGQESVRVMPVTRVSVTDSSSDSGWQVPNRRVDYAALDSSGSNSLKKIENLGPLARGFVWGLILDKPLSLKNPDDQSLGG